MLSSVLTRLNSAGSAHEEAEVRRKLSEALALALNACRSYVPANSGPAGALQTSVVDGDFARSHTASSGGAVVATGAQLASEPKKETDQTSAEGSEEAVSEVEPRFQEIDRLLQAPHELDEYGVLQGLGEGTSTDTIVAYFHRLFEEPDSRLASYGTLRPGEVNEWVVAHIPGRWFAGEVRGRLDEHEDFPVFWWDEGGGRIPVEVFASLALPHELPRIDEFEGENYERILVPVDTAGDTIVANIYAAALPE